MPMALGYKEKYLKQKTTYHRPVDESYGYVDESYGYGSHIYTGLSKRLLCPDRMIL